jgi:hypothetical protein
MEPTTSSQTNHTFLEELRRRRGELRESLDAVELSLSAPAAVDRAGWVRRVHEALGGLGEDLQHHIEITEGDEGLYSELLAASPRLSEAVSRLAAEHTAIRKQLDDLLARVDGADDLEDVTVVRDLGTDLLGALIRHRQRGADLVYEAYEFDIGGDT